jgi:hypothetical protein
MGGPSLEDREQDCIISGFHHGGALHSFGRKASAENR